MLHTYRIPTCYTLQTLSLEYIALTRFGRAATICSLARNWYLSRWKCNYNESRCCDEEIRARLHNFRLARCATRSKKERKKEKKGQREREKGGGKEKNKRIKKIHREETATNLHVESVHACLGLNERQRRAEKVTF